MLLNLSYSTQLNFRKIHFTIQKRVKFGQALYISGNSLELGSWQPEKAYRLRWS